MNIDPTRLGMAIKRLRRSRGLTQETVASRLSVSTNFLSLLENGKRGISLPHLNELANILGVPAAFLTFLGSSCPTGNDHASRLMKQIQSLIEKVVDADAKLSRGT